MPTESLRISMDSEIRILTECDYTCCFCREEGKDIGVHALDDDSLLFALCDDCFQLAKAYPEGRKSISPEELRVTKRVWEAAMRRTPELVRDRNPSETRVFGWSWSSEIKQIDLFLASHISMTACEVLASEDTPPHASRLLRKLCQLAIWRPDKEIRGRVYEALAHISEVVMFDSYSALVAPVATALGSLSDYIYSWEESIRCKEDLFWLGGPLASLRAMGLNTMTDEGIDAVAEQVENIFLRGLWCQQKKVVSEAIKVVRRLVNRCSGDGDRHLPFPYGEHRLRSSADVMLRFIRKYGKNWRYEIRILRDLAVLE